LDHGEGEVKFASPAYDDIPRIFGPSAGKDCTAGRVILPFPFVIAWDRTQKINSFAAHKLAAPVFTSIIAEAVKHYGEKQFRALRLDYFGGCFNDRPMRGSTKRSTHAWGIAWDIDPARNQLKWGQDRASLARPEYLPFWNIVEAHGAVSLGRTRNFDWMHVQLSKA
jgi:D-alanyl-D-alanine carboxypeptidase